MVVQRQAERHDNSEMQDIDRFRLHFDPETPLFEYGDLVWCECRGDEGDYRQGSERNS